MKTAGPAHLRGVTQGDIQIARQPAFLEDQGAPEQGSFPAAARKDRSTISRGTGWSTALDR